LRRDGVGLRARTLHRLVNGGEVRAELVEIRLRGGAGDVGDAGTAAKKQRGEQEEGSSARRTISRRRG
jgi:hypothetical protein